MPRKYKSLIPLLEGEEFDYSNELNLFDDGLPNERIQNFEVSTGDYDATGEDPAPSVAANVQRALSCYQLRTSGLQAHVVENAHYTSGAIILKSGVHLIPGRYECRVMFPKKSNSAFSFRLFGRYTDGTRGQIYMLTPNGAVEGNIYNNISCYTNNTNSDPVHDSKVCTISKDLNDGNFHTIGWDWYYSENHKCVKFFIDNTELTTLNVSPGFPLVLYAACLPDPYLSLQRGDFDYDYAEVDYIRFTAFANQTINTTGTFKEDTNRGGAITTTVSDNVIIPRILKASDHGGSEVVVSKTTKDQQEIIVRNFNQGNKKFTIDTNGNRDAYNYGTYSATVESKITVPSVVEATINGKKAIYPVIANVRAKLNKIEGNSIVWNQLCPNFKETINGQLRQCWYRDGGDMTITEENGELVATLMVSDSTGVIFRLRPYNATANSNLDLMRNLPPRYHKVLFKFDARAEGTDAEGWDWGNWILYISTADANNPTFPNTMKPGEWTTFTYIQEMTLRDMICCFFHPSYPLTSGLTGKNIGCSMRRVMVFDLTLMFGKGNEPTIEEFNRLFPNTYYPWVAEGELKKTTINSIKSYDKDGTELDSIDKLTNIDLISATTNSKYHQSIEVSNTINLSAYTYDGAETYKIDKISNVSDKDLSTLGFNSSTNNENVYSVWNDSIDSCYSASDYPPTGGSPYDYPYAPILSNKYNNGISSRRIESPADNTTYNKFISFGGNENTLYIKDNSITTDMKLYLNNIKGKTMKYTQLISVAGYPSNQTISGVTFTFNKTTGEILVNGTATEDIALKINDKTGIPFVPTSMICLKGCPSGGSTSTYYLSWVDADYKDVGNGNYSKLNSHMTLTDTTGIYLSIQIIIKSGTVMNNKRFYPQLFNVSDMYGLGKEPKTIADFNKDFPHSFYPYSNREIRSVAIKQLSIKPGYKNLCDYNKFIAKPTYTNNGITITNNNDGTVTINGTSTTSASVLPLQDIVFDTSHIYYASEKLAINYGAVINGGKGNPAIIRLQGTPVVSNKWSNGVYYYYSPNTTVDNFTTTPRVIDLTLTYGAGNEPRTVAQFNQDFPNIDDIPYAEQKITFASPIILNGINTAQDILKIVKDNYQYSLVKEESIGSVDLGTTPVSQVYRSYETGHKYYQVRVDDIKNSASYSLSNVLMSRYTTATEPNVYSNVYNLTISAVPGNLLMIYDKDAYDNMTNQEFLDSLAGQILYYERKTPVTTTLYSLTPSNVAALFAKGYYIEVVGNDTNKDIIRPDVTVNIPCLNGTSYIDKEITFTNLDKEAIDGKMTGLTYHKKAIFRKELQGIHAYYGAKDTTTTELYSGLSFEDISLQIAEGGYIEVDYTGVQPNVSFDFPVQLYKIYEASYGKVDVVALDSQLQNAKYNTSLQLNNIKGRSVKWTQLVKTSLFKDTQTINGVTFTFNKTNGTITVNGTATEDISFTIMKDDGALNSLWTPADYAYMRGCPTGGSLTTYYLLWGNTAMKDTGTGIYDKPSKSATQIKDTTVVYTGLQIIIKSGVTMTNKVFRPQLFNVSDIYGLGKEPATITDFNKDYPYDIYPYGEQEILTTKVSGIKIRAGYKNLLDKTKFAVTQTINGVTFTNNGDGSYTLNGTATKSVYFNVQTFDIPVSSNNSVVKYLMRGYEFEPGDISTSVQLYLDNFYIVNSGLLAVRSKEGNIAKRNNVYNATNVRCRIKVSSNYTCNNLVIRPQLINLTNTYGEGNEPTTVAQFNKDFPDINDIPYPEQTISFVEQTLYGINNVQDTLQVVKENDGYKLDLIHNITSIDMGDMNYYKWIYQGNTLGWVTYSNENPFRYDVSSSSLPPALLTKNFATVGRQFIEKKSDNTWGYNKTICIDQYNTIYSQNKDVTTGAEYKESVKGQILYGAARTPTTTTLATLTKNQVTALFAKGYCVEILGNDDNKIIVRPDLSLSIPIYPEEIVQTVNLDDINVSDTNIEQEDTTTENFDENGPDVAVNETTEESTSDNID